jgi:intracellular multiplication protein IcmC
MFNMFKKSSTWRMIKKVHQWLIKFITLNWLVMLAYGADDTHVNTSISIDQMLMSLNESIPQLFLLVTAVSYVMGMYLMCSGVMKMRTCGDTRSAAQGGDLRGALTTIVIGILFVYLPSTLKVTLSTIYGNDTVTAYDSSGTWYDQTLAVVVSIVQLVGLISFIRGLIIFYKVGNGNSQQVTIGKGVTHVVGGILAFNLLATVDILATTFGLF